MLCRLLGVGLCWGSTKATRKGVASGLRLVVRLVALGVYCVKVSSASASDPRASPSSVSVLSLSLNLMTLATCCALFIAMNSDTRRRSGCWLGASSLFSVSLIGAAHPSVVTANGCFLLVPAFRAISS